MTSPIGNTANGGRAFEDITIGTSPRLAVRVWRGSGPTFVVLHGLTHNLEVWTPLVAHLPSDACLVALDLRGHGESGSAAGHDYNSYADDLFLVIEECCDRKPFVVGHSWGARVALFAASRRPAALRGVVAIEQALWNYDPPRHYLTPTDRLEPLPTPVLTDPEIQAVLDESRGWGAWAPVVARSYKRSPVGWTPRPTPSEVRALTLSEARSQPVEQRYGTINCPIMFVFATDEDDFGFAPPIGRQRNVAHLQATVASGRFEWVDGDHGLHVERPDQVGRLLRDFAAEN